MKPFFLFVLTALLCSGLRYTAAARPLAAAPTITSFSPGYGVPGTVITLTGTDLAGTSSVELGGVPMSFTVASATRLTATVPVGAATGLLRVATADGVGSSATVFTVVTNSPANCRLNITLTDGATTDVPIYVSGVAGTLGSGLSLTAVDLSLAHEWDSDLVITLISPAGQEVALSVGNGGSGDNYGKPANCPADVTHFTDAATVSILSGAPPFIGSYRPQSPLTGFNTGSPNGVWKLRVLDASTPDQGTLHYVKLSFVVPAPDLVVSTTATVPAGTYRNLTVTGTGDALLGGAVVIEGELLVENGGVLRPGCQPLTGTGSFTLAAGATLVVCDGDGIASSGLSGAVQVSGPRTFSSDASYQYVGPGNQSTGPGLPGIVRSLSLSSGATLRLSNVLTVTQALTLTSGTLHTNGWYVRLGAVATLTEAASGYLLGLALTTRDLATTAPNDFGGLGLTLTPDPARPTVPGVTTLSRFTGEAIATGSNHSIRRYYLLEPGNDLRNATLTLGYTDAELAGLGKADLSVFRSRDPSTGSWQKLGASSRDAAANTVTATGVNEFQYLTLASAAAPLPVELVEFTAQQQGQAAVLRWTTAQEKNCDHFDVEMSLDGRQYQLLGTVAGHGTTATRHDYRFDDAQLPRHGAATVYYRLWQVDADGHSQYSPVRAVGVQPAATPPFTVFPTLLAAGETLHYALAEAALPAPASLAVYAATGQLVHAQPATAAAGQLTLPALPPGWYAVQLRAASGGQVLVARFEVL